ncbi:extracellular solute-binding protein [Amphibacillus xylanus]|uniref:Putative ABC transporter substrate-binding protein n=1 Tax=Amphibacillus xylanus (strain ATCC 51415 / DSM 6626 / JCM 7361 / LMG 17667 / NBRC 15112 / Ep01) TaxID=698758 RepID=K0J1P6_AMPXN|nr:extracellular solute-binding protein [Amphibacillus xylanus]BAM46401.1 putative ABC transporter substrate-binding protein [Amphibacillus xylanus NBRC 15112]
MFKKKSLLLLLIIGLLVFFVACGDDSDNKVSTDDEPGTAETKDDETKDDGAEDEGLGYTTDPQVEYHYFVGATGQDINTKDTFLGQKFLEETGVSFQVEYLVGDLMEKLGVMVAGGTYPDLIVPDHGIEMMLDAGAFIPLNDLLEEHGPNLLEVYGPYLDRITMTDGNIYYLPFGVNVNEYIPDPNINQGAFWVQRDVLRVNDYPKITTVDELFELITAYADENPQIDGMNTIPFTGLTYDTNWFTFSNIPNHLAGFPNDGGVQVDMETHEATVYGDSDVAYEWLKKLNELNAEGYLDQEMFVMNLDDFLAKVSSGRVLSFFAYGWQFGSARTALEELDEPYREFVPLPIVIEEGIEDQYLDPPAFVQNRGVGISVNADNPERIIQFLDNLVREENQKLISWGNEGEHHEVDENGMFYRTEEQVELVADQDFRLEYGMTTFEWDWPRLQGSLKDGNALLPSAQPAVAALEYDEYDKEVLGAYGVETYSQLFAEPQDRPWYPAWSANVPAGSEPALFDEKAQEVTKRHYPRIVLADPADFEKEWNDFKDAYRSIEYLDEYEAFFTETVKNRVNGIWQFD